MRWSKLRQRVEESFAPSVQGRVHVYSSSYQSSCARGWFRVDGRDIADFSTIAFYSRYMPYFNGTIDSSTLPAISDDERTSGRLVEKGEFSGFEFREACWEYIHSNAHDCMNSENPLVAKLAVLSAKVGKRTLRRLAKQRLHPLTRALLVFRMEEEGIIHSKKQNAPDIDS
jgi:hypothetical protein